MNSKQQVIKDFEECIAFQKSVGEDTRGVENDLKYNIWYYENKPYHICSKCKRLARCSYDDTTNERMTTKQLCFGCNLWEERAETEFQKDNVFVAGRTMYTIGSYGISKGEFLGHGGRVFKITYPDGTEHISNKVWCGGDLPFWLVDGYKTAIMESVNNDLQI